MNQEVYFHGIESEIVKTIKSAQSSIDIAVAWITSSRIIKQLEIENSNGVTIRILTTSSKINENDLLENLQYCENITLKYVSNKLMHNKFSIIDKKTLINGSYNWTEGAKSNSENITISKDNLQLINEFQTEFNRLWDQGNLVNLKYGISEDQMREIYHEKSNFKRKKMIRSTAKPPYFYYIHEDVNIFNLDQFLKTINDINVTLKILSSENSTWTKLCKGHYYIENEKMETDFFDYWFYSSYKYSRYYLGKCFSIPNLKDLPYVFQQKISSTCKYKKESGVSPYFTHCSNYLTISLEDNAHNGKIDSRFDSGLYLAELKDEVFNIDNLIKIEQQHDGFFTTMLLKDSSKNIYHENDDFNSFKDLKTKYFNEVLQKKIQGGSISISEYILISYSIKFGNNSLKKICLFSISGNRITLPIYDSFTECIENKKILEFIEKPLLTAKGYPCNDSECYNIWYPKQEFHEIEKTLDSSNLTKRFIKPKNDTKITLDWKAAMRQQQEIIVSELSPREFLWASDENYGPLYFALAQNHNKIKLDYLTINKAKSLYQVQQVTNLSEFEKKVDEGKLIIEKINNERNRAKNTENSSGCLTMIPFIFLLCCLLSFLF